MRSVEEKVTAETLARERIVLEMRRDMMTAVRVFESAMESGNEYRELTIRGKHLEMRFTVREMVPEAGMVAEIGPPKDSDAGGEPLNP